MLGIFIWLVGWSTTASSRTGDVEGVGALDPL